MPDAIGFLFWIKINALKASLNVDGVFRSWTLLTHLFLEFLTVAGGKPIKTSEPIISA